MRLPNRAALFTAARFFAVLILLLCPWPGLGRAYALAFNVLATPCMSVVSAASGSEVSLDRFPESDKRHEWSTMVRVTDESHTVRHTGAGDLKRAGYLQIATWLASAVAFPLKRRARFAAILGGGVLFFTMFGCLPVCLYLARKGVLHLGMVLFAALALSERALVGAPGMAFALPALGWLLAVWSERPRPLPATTALPA